MADVTAPKWPFNTVLTDLHPYHMAVILTIDLEIIQDEKNNKIVIVNIFFDHEVSVLFGESPQVPNI